VLEADRVVFEPSWYCGDWPAGVEAPERYMHWKRRHWQLARAVAEAGGSMGADAIEDTAGSIGFNYAREFGLYYRGEPMFRKRQQTVALARAGQVFVAEWEQSFAD
jgi:hypothetical protein